jgi:hypothetical protein
MLLLVGGLLSGLLGWRLWGWWAPAVLACVVLVLQAVANQGVLAAADGTRDLIQILTMTALTSLFLFYAVYSMGRSLGLRWRKQR